MTEPAQAFNKKVTDAMPGTPTLSSVMRRAVNWGAQNLNVCMPGSVLAVDSRLRVDVQPLLMARYAAEAEATLLKPICGVPVATLAGASWSVSGPVAVGDQGLLVFADRSLDAWLAGDGSPADPQDGRLHHISDAIFLPGLLTDPQAEAAVAGLGDDLVLQNGLAAVRLKKTGQLALGNGTVELVSLVASLAQAVADLATALSTATAPNGPVTSGASASAASSVLAQANKIKGA